MGTGAGMQRPWSWRGSTQSDRSGVTAQSLRSISRVTLQEIATTIQEMISAGMTKAVTRENQVKLTVSHQQPFVNTSQPAKNACREVYDTLNRSHDPGLQGPTMEAVIA